MNTYLIKIPFFTHIICISKFSMCIVKMKTEKFGVLTCTARCQGFGSISVDLRSYQSLSKVQSTDLKIFMEP